jgi:hypothetical protein
VAQLLTATGTPVASAAQPGSAAAGAPLRPPSQAPSQAPRHCGLPMEWTDPAEHATTVHSFDADSSAGDLPPVWRCFCGFQLDSIVHTSNALAALS